MVVPSPALVRPALSADRLAAELVRRGSRHVVRVVEETASTNADVVAAAAAGAPAGLVIVAEWQRAGRGRLTRAWSSPPRAGLTASMLLRPTGDPTAWPLLGLLTGLAVVSALQVAAGVEARLKWPNDVMVGGRKLAGILAERVPDGVVVGVGCNVDTRREELPVETASSVVIEGGRVDREQLLLALLEAVDGWQQRWEATGPAEGLAAYRAVSDTIGRPVRLQLSDDRYVDGVATDVDGSGRLLIADSTGTLTAWASGDVTHLRAAPGGPLSSGVV